MDIGISLLMALSAVILRIKIILKTKKTKTNYNDNINSLYVITTGVFVSAFFMFIPIYINYFDNSSMKWMKAILLSIHNAIRLFIVDGEYSIVLDYLPADSSFVYNLYTVFFAVIFVLAPVLTFGVVLSFFKNMSSYVKYYFRYNRDVYIFSDLNEKSIILAESIKEKQRKAVIVFNDVFENNDEMFFDLQKKAEFIDAIIFKNDIVTVKYYRHSKNNKIMFFIIGDDEKENIFHTVKIVSRYRDRENTELIIFSKDKTSELMLTSIDRGHIKLRRIDDVKSSIYRYLYDRGQEIYENAVETGNGKKSINVALIGMNDYGNTMFKALLWYCQMDGYELTIDVFDKDKDIYSKLYAKCPEILSPKYNGVKLDGEAQYTINVHSSINYTLKEFSDKFSELNRLTHIFIDRDNEEENIRTAIYARMLCERNGINPVIQTVLDNTDVKKSLKDIKNFKNQLYNIDFIGDKETVYSFDAVLNQELENDALKRHMQWGADENTFWSYEYNYSSSMALAIHTKLRRCLGVPGALKNTDELYENEKIEIENIEHKRWNAYMRSEGYIYSGSLDKSSRNDMAKMHNDLVSYNALAEDIKRLDSIVGAK